MALCGVPQYKLNITIFPLTDTGGLSEQSSAGALGVTFWADGVGSRRRTLFHPLSLSESFTRGPLSFLGLLLGVLPLLFSRPLALTPRTRKWKSFNWEMCLLMTLGSIPAWQAILSGTLITLHGWPFLKVSVVLSLLYISIPSLFQRKPGCPPSHFYQFW